MVERVGRIAEVRADTSSDRSSIEAALADEAAVRAWLDAASASLITQLRAHCSFVEAPVAEASRSSLNAAATATERADTLERAAPFAAALDDARVTAGHIDALTRAGKQLDTDTERAALFDRADELVDVAAVATIDEFRRKLASEVAAIRRDDGETRLARQRAAVRVSTWTDPDGMWNVRGRFDPVVGIALAAKLDTAVDTLFAEAMPDHCPTDPVEKQRFLAGHALARLLQGDAGARGGVRSGRPEYVAVIDADAPERDGPMVEWAIPVEIPARVLAELTGTADTHAVIVRNGIVLHAPGNLNLGRTSRLANRDQRRALRGLYRGCAIPGCSVAYDRCKLHHIIWWRHGGRTDLDNLLPVCAKHHGRHPQRRLDDRTRTRPTTHPHPPRRHHPQHRTTHHPRRLRRHVDGGSTRPAPRSPIQCCVERRSRRTRCGPGCTRSVRAAPGEFELPLTVCVDT